MAVAGGGLATTLAGCSSPPPSGDDGPAATVEAYFSAIEDDDREAANDLIHPDGEVEEVGELAWMAYQETNVEGTYGTSKRTAIGRPSPSR